MNAQSLKNLYRSMHCGKHLCSRRHMRSAATTSCSRFAAHFVALLVMAIPTRAGIADQPTRASTERSSHSRSAVALSTKTRASSTVLMAQACLPCTPGCADANSGCQPGTANAACGSDGNACTPCASDEVCQNHVCVRAFDCTTSCPSGCCWGNQCVAFQSQTNAACGSGGSICLACAAGTVCYGGACCTPIPQGTACSGHACNEFASDGCGGTYSCDNCPQGTTCGKCQVGVCFNSTGSCF
jgi:hypothetical protein